MADKQNPEVKPTQNLTPPTDPPKIPTGCSGGTHYPNPPETVNPDAATLRDQWRFAIRQYMVIKMLMRFIKLDDCGFVSGALRSCICD
ncbi:Polyvinyl alcohol dehydrogenase (cytochrome) [Olea europaea subsp. europaea]|uniref:Polyvinyl alcohol dehydrogenase (Cytochrome) n=1 Tax=Olea europaea subsp. europaea TaxID=158383 RepID=A0A8S0TQC1_OLEEU|nr:Polyvinyl alcohol dehydrogenase (cytochrome) [Olea europaea subsp. europaea]